MSNKKERASKIIKRMQNDTNKLEGLCKHSDEFVRVEDLKIDLNKIKEAFETQIEE